MANTPKFTDDDIELVLKSLPREVNQRRRKLLPKILREWGQTELPSHLSLEPRAVTRKRIEKVHAVDGPASDLLRALDALDEIERNVIVDRIVRHEWSNSAVAKFPKVKQQLGMVHNFLSRLNSAGPSQTPELRAHNFAAYFVLMDIAGIFEWLTDTEATRQVDRAGKGGKGDIGPFWDFAKVIWPLVFHNGTYGLSAAMKNWASARSEYGEQSSLILNIRLRHPCWRLSRPKSFKVTM